jgi:hypothetical protein
MKLRKLNLLAQAVGILTLACIAIFSFENLQMPKPETNQPSVANKIPTLTKSTSKIVSKAGGKISVNQESKTSKGYNLYPVAATAEVLLISMKGDVVHKWNVDAERARLLPNGNLLVIHGSKWGKDVSPWRELRDEIREYDWNGKIVWKHKADDVAHHDLQRVANGNTLYLRRTILPSEFKKKIADVNKRSQEIRADSIIEINKSGEQVWQWNTFDHLDLNSCGRRPCREIDDESMAADKGKDWTHVNTLSIIPENKWYSEGDQRFKPGNIIFLPRNFWTAYIIDRDTGKIVWEFGGDYRGGISGGHEATMIPMGFPGAGNILIIDNGTKIHQGESFILEINPQTKQAEWIYDVGTKFFTATRGSVQRLVNGNTLISEDNTGRLFEVTKDKELVWEYKGTHLSSRASRYPIDYCPQFKSLDK